MNTTLSGLGLLLRGTGLYRLIPDGGFGNLTLANGAGVMVVGCVEPGMQSTLDRLHLRHRVCAHLRQKTTFRPGMRWLMDGGPCLAGIVPRMAADKSYRDRILNDEMYPLLGEHGTEHIVYVDHTHCAGRKMLLQYEPDRYEEEDHISSALSTLAEATRARFPGVQVHTMVALLNGRHDAFRGIIDVDSLEGFTAQRTWERKSMFRWEESRVTRHGVCIQKPDLRVAAK